VIVTAKALHTVTEDCCHVVSKEWLFCNH